MNRKETKDFASEKSFAIYFPLSAPYFFYFFAYTGYSGQTLRLHIIYRFANKFAAPQEKEKLLKLGFKGSVIAGAGRLATFQM